MKKVVRKALLTAKAYRPGKAGGGMLMPGHPQREANRAAFMGQNHPDVPEVLYHGSNSAFPSFDRDEVKHNQLGFHVGSINQANHFASDPREENFNRPKKPNVMPVHIMAKNPLRLKDEGEWSAENLRDQLLEAGAKHEDVARLISLEQQESITPADIANVIKSLGYDSVVYLNRNEGVDQKDKAEYAKKMAGQWSDPKGVSYKSMYKLDDDEFRQNFPSARDSYILFDPSQIKSATGNQGAFDPNEDDINKAAGGSAGYADGGSTGKLHARLVNSMNFYSRGAEAARQLSQKKGSPQQMRAMLEKAGVKPEEFAQSGFDEAFSGKPSVTSEEIFQHFHHKKPDVRATQLLSREHDDYDPDTTYETQFDEFTLHGLQNYREHLLKLPEGNNNFEESRHWPGQKNVVAHIRMGDRRTPADLAASRDAIEKMRADPNLTRSIGEEPANWGSGAADLAVSRGTITKEEAQNLSRIKRWRNAVMEGYKPERVLHVEEIQSDWGQAGRKHGFQDQSADGPPDPNKPPQGPFVNSTPGWTNLALKHVLTEAVKGGYNKLVISPGQANADMYGLDEGRENGMKSFYDQIVPTQLNKLAKGLDPDHPGVQMFSHTLPPAWGGDEEGYKGHALEITDGMRDAVKKGLPMYKRGGMAPISNPMVGKAMALARNLTRR